MPKHIWQDSGKGKVLWIVDWSTENHTSPDKIDISMLPDALNIRNNEENISIKGAAFPAPSSSDINFL